MKLKEPVKVSMDKNNKIYVHFHNPICPFSNYICTATEEYRCLPIQAHYSSDWILEATKRGKYCNYRGIDLTQNEIQSREMNIKKANQCKYLMR
jgi:hypothetical protein